MTFQIFLREFLRIVRSKGFLIGTFGTPIAIALYFAAMGIVSWMFTDRTTDGSVIDALGLGDEPKTVGIFDDSKLRFEDPGPLHKVEPGRRYIFHDRAISKMLGEVTAKNATSDAKKDLSDQTTSIPFLRLSELAEGKDFLSIGKIDALAHIPADYIDTGMVLFLIKESEEQKRIEDFQHPGALRQLLVSAIYAKHKIPPQGIERLEKGATFTEKLTAADGSYIEDEDNLTTRESLLTGFAEKGIPYAFAFMMVAIILTNSSRLVNSLREERENKLVDVLLTTVSARELICGKVLGILCASLCQLSLWIGVVLLFPAIYIRYVNLDVQLNVQTGQFLFSLVFAVLGMLFYGFFYCGAGAFKKDPNEESGIKEILHIGKLLIFYGLIIYLPGASDVIWRLVATIPFLTPLLMPFQLMDESFSLLDISMYLVLMSLSTFIMLQFSTRLFRLRLMHKGEAIGDFSILMKALRAKENF